MSEWINFFLFLGIWCAGAAVLLYGIGYLLYYLDRHNHK